MDPSLESDDIACVMLITAVGMLIDQSWSRPSLGINGAGASTASLPDVIDAQPVS